MDAGDLVIFEVSGAAIDFLAKADSVFVLRSAAKHPHKLFMGNYSVHTSPEALRLGEAGFGSTQVACAQRDVLNKLDNK